jgi:lipid-binding SYLF domain-containing protein
MDMKKRTSKEYRRLANALVLATVTTIALNARVALAASASEIDGKANEALRTLYANTPGAKDLAMQAKGVLVFPNIVKGGFIVAGQYGDGALRRQGERKTAAYYRSIAASYGLQAGVQSFGYALLFMDDESLAHLEQSRGWEIGTGPSVVILDKGFGKSMSTTTMRKGVYAFIFSQKGLMAGLGLQGSKITPITPDQ